MMAIALVVPILFSTAGAIVILWWAVPSGFSCRHAKVIVTFVQWILSAAFTSGLYSRYKGKWTEQMIWRIALFEDSIIAAGARSQSFFDRWSLWGPNKTP